MKKFGTLKEHGNHIFKVVADKKYMEKLYQDMIAEVNRRKEYRKRKSKTA